MISDPSGSEGHPERVPSLARDESKDLVKDNMRKLFLPVLICMVFANAAYSKGIWTVKSTDDPDLGVLYLVWKVHVFGDRENDLSIRVFETGGGDPAMNGNRIIVVANGARPGMYPLRIWKTGVDVSWVKKVEYVDRTIILSVSEHYFSDGDTKIRDAVYKLTYDMKTGIVRVQKSMPSH